MANAGKIINVTSYRVIYGDTDQMGVVYYANYLRWFERGRSECFAPDRSALFNHRAARLSLPGHRSQLPLRQLGALRRRRKNRNRARRTRPRVAVVQLPNHPRNRSMDILATGSTKHACIDHAGKVTRIPTMLLDALKAAR